MINPIKTNKLKVGDFASFNRHTYEKIIKITPYGSGESHLLFHTDGNSYKIHKNIELDHRPAGALNLIS